MKKNYFGTGNGWGLSLPNPAGNKSASTLVII